MEKVVSERNSQKFDKWFKGYVEGVNLENIEWVKLNYDQLMKFYYKYYFDDDYEEFVMSRGEDDSFLPFGMTYLPINPGTSRDEYILGLCDNQSGTKTIVACMIFDPSYNLDREVVESVTYIKTIETNTFFQKKGVFNKMINEILKFINKDQNILTTHESVRGRVVHVLEKMRNAVTKQGFTGDVRSEYEINEEYLDSLKKIKYKKKVL